MRDDLAGFSSRKAARPMDRSIVTTWGFYDGDFGMGIFIIVSVKIGRLSNLMTFKSLEVIANNGGQRCCKRESYAAIETAVGFVKDNIGVEIPISKVECQFSPMNRECKRQECKYFRKGAQEYE
jgi:hypothetical protein